MKYRDKMETPLAGAAFSGVVPHVQTPFFGLAPARCRRSGSAGRQLENPRHRHGCCTDLVDNVGDIHPSNKQPYGQRSLCSRQDYGKRIGYSGPLYKGMKVESSKVRVSFAHVGGGLMVRGGKGLSEFEIAGKDGKFVTAEATIDGSTVIVQAPSVAEPTQVRFGWRNTANPTLMNKEGLPASPFRSLDWQGGTAE